MAEKLVVIDDLDGTEGATTRTFSIDGEDYQIDLTDANHKKMIKAFEKYTQFGRKVSRAPRRAVRSPARAPHGGVDNDTLREWARKKGMTVSSRGRVRKEIVDAFNKDQKSGTSMPAFTG